MKYPKSVIIGGRDWTVKYKPKESGGSYDAGKSEIVVGTKHKKDILDIFLHETIEAILGERCHKYNIYNTGNEKLLFSFDHAEFNNLIPDIKVALKDIIK